jgi:hypothetical protein
LKNGQFRTPRHIIDLLTAMVNPQTGQLAAWRLMLPLLRREEKSLSFTGMSVLAIARKGP